MFSQKTITWTLGIFFAIAIGILLATGIRSGLLFQLDQDEFAHAQVSYLLMHGYTPYKQFFMTYTPVFHSIIAPIFIFAGYTMKSMVLARWFMILLFLLRVAVSGWIALRVFGKRVAALFVLFFLTDPFTMYTAMQIRPDNLMMLLFTIGIALYISKKYFWSGILFASSVIVLLKIAPSLLIIGLAIVFNKKVRIPFFAGLAIPLLLFSIFVSNDMMTQVVRDSYTINQSVAFPIPTYHFYEIGKSALFDLYGDAWARLPYFELMLLLLAAIGIVAVKKSRMIEWILAGSLIAQAISLIFVRSVFIQYFLPLTWLIDLFAAAAIMQFIRTRTTFIILIVILSVCIYDSVNANITRSHAISNDQTKWITAAWKQIPENATVYPNIPFRPIAYPLTFGYYFHDLPPSITKRLPPLVLTLTKTKPEYILQTYEWKALPQNFFPYVADNYHKIDPGVFIRN